MPTYSFRCKKCETHFDELCSYSERHTISCRSCGSRKVEQLITAPSAVIFKEPKGTSREDNFDYVAKWNMANAEDLRRRAEAANHQGSSPYPEIDDITSGDHFGEVK